MEDKINKGATGETTPGASNEKKGLTPAEQEIAKLQQQLKEANALTAKKDAELEEVKNQSSQVINDLSNQLEQASIEVKYKSPVVKIKEEDYKITILYFNYKGQSLTAEDVKNNTELALELLEIGFAGLEKIA